MPPLLMRFFPISLLAVILGFATIARGTPAVVPGSLPGDVTVDNTGAVSYSIPIEMPAGTGGMQPELALTYSNQSGNGPFGMGWSLSGLSSITRGPTIYARDGFSDGVDFDSSDKFYLDGQRLVEVGRSTASPWFVEYRTELESFSRIRAYGASLDEAASKPTHWSVETKAGLKMWFGRDDNGNDHNSLVVFNRLEDGNMQGGPIGWQICRVTDTCGNHFDYYYKTDSAYGSTLLIDEIRYTANGSSLSHYAKVKFNYEARTDSVRSGFFGFKSKLVGRVKNIQIQLISGASDDYLARYDFGYEYSQMGLSRITSVMLTRKDGTSEAMLNPSRFWYSEGVIPFKKSGGSGLGVATTPTTIGVGVLGSWDLDNAPQFHTVDLNGDTKPELIKQQRTSGSSGILKYTYQVYNPGSSGFTASGSSQTFVDYSVSILRAILGNSTVDGLFSDSQIYESAVFADFNLDGKTDVFVNSVLVANVNASGNFWRTIRTRRLLLKTDTGWQQVYNNQVAVATSDTRDRARANWEFLPADVDGDGSMELIQFDPEPVSGKVRVKILKTSNPASGTYFDTTAYVHDKSGNYLDVSIGTTCDLRAFLMDHDGDGTPDIATYTSSGLSIHMMAAAGASGSTGEGSLGTIRNWPSGLKGSTSAPFIVTFTPSQLGDIAWNSNDTLMPVDMDGDGRDDLIRVAFATGKICSIRLPLSGVDTFDSSTPNPPWIGTNPPSTIRDPLPGEAEAYASAMQALNQARATDAANGLRDTVMYTQLSLPCGTASTVYALNVVPSDVDGDGDIDLIVGYSVKNSSNTLSSGTTLYLGSPTDSQRGVVSFSEDTTQRGSGYGAPSSMSDPREFVDQFTMFDTDLDGLPELVQFRKQSSGSIIEARRWRLYSNSIPVVNGVSCPWGNLLYYAENGNGTGAWVVYKPMTDSTVYTRLTNRPTYPFVESYGPFPLASDVGRESADGVAYWSTYGYAGALAHVQGRGSLGFATFTSYDWDTGIAEAQRLEQAFPFTGMVKETQRYRWLSAGGLTTLSKDENVNSFDVVRVGSSTTGASVFPMVIRSTSQKWEDDNTADYNSSGAWVGPNPYSVVVSKTWFDDQDTSIDTTARTAFDDDNPQGDLALRYGNITKIVIDSGDGYSTTTLNTYEDVSESGSWILGRLKKSVATSKAPDQTDVTRSSAFKYDAKGLLVQEFVQPTSDTGSTLGARTVKTYVRDAYGNISSESVAGAFGARDAVNSYAWTSTTLVTRSNLDATKRFYQTTRNALDHEETSTFDFWGRKLSSTGPNGLVTQGSYPDPFGIHVIESRPDSTVAESNVTILPADKRFSVAAPSGVGVINTPSLAYTVKTSSASGAPETRVYYDRFGREIRSETEGFNGAVIRKDTLYDKYGRAIAVSGNYYADSAARPDFGDLPDFATSQWVRSEYDMLGRVSRVIAPNGSETRYIYNGRVSKVIADAQSGGKAQTQTTLVNEIGKTIKVWNADRDTSGISQLGTGASGSTSVEFTYDAIGNLIQTVADNATTTMSYDLAGNKIGMVDADMGAWTYEYDALGRLRFQTDAKGQTTEMSYDVLGRLQKRVTRDPGNGAYEVTRWEYDGSGEFDWIGALRREYVLVENAGNANADVLETPTAAQIRTQHGYQYDELGRQIIDLRQVDGKWYYNYTRYDAYGRVSTINYFWRPAGLEDTPSSSAANWQSFGLTYTYTTTGFLVGITDHQNRCWWDSPTYDQQGRVIQARKGTVWTRRDYRETDGSLATIKSGFSAGANTLQDLAYTFDNLGNLTSRTDGYRTHQGTGSPTTALSETFEYDNLNRLVSRNGAAIATYSANGNILWKKDVNGVTSDYYYGPRNGLQAGPHAVSEAFDYKIGYDANGLMATRTKTGQATPWSFTWTRSNMVKWIFDDHDGSEYEYDGSDARIMEIRKVDLQAVEKKIFCPGFEQFFDKNTTTGAWKAKLIRVHIGAPDGLVGTYEYKPGQTNMASAQSLTLLFTDHLGSVDLAINIAGGASLNFLLDSTRTKYSYDPWGERRNATTWVGKYVPTSTELAAMHTDKGYTGHEMLDELGLINMNARIYDPQLGRFLSADSIVQNAGDLQSYNRYSYCGNNPLCRIDPSGHSWLSSAFKGVGDFFSKYWKPIVAIVLSIVTAGAVMALYYSVTLLQGISIMFGATMVGTLATGYTIISGGVGLCASILAGAAAGAVAGSITSGTLEGAAWGALGGAITGAIGSFGKTYKWNLFKRAAAHGVSGGLMSEAQGGKFAQGMYSGAASTLGAGMLPEDSAYLSKLFASAVAGGTASVVGGGKFENGAVTGAFRYIINDAIHSWAGDRQTSRNIRGRNGDVVWEKSKEAKYAYIRVLRVEMTDDTPVSVRWLGNYSLRFGLTIYVITKGNIVPDSLEMVFAENQLAKFEFAWRLKVTYEVVEVYHRNWFFDREVVVSTYTTEELGYTYDLYRNATIWCPIDNPGSVIPLNLTPTPSPVTNEYWMQYGE